jgi:regulatory protein
VPRRSSRASSRPQTPAAALDLGLRLLGRRAHSRLELRRKLRLRGYDEQVVEGALARLAEMGYLDDQEFARGLVRRRSALRGPLALSAELASKGIDRAQVEVALGTFDAEAQLASATRLAERLYAKKPGAGYQEILNGVGSKLMRRGFNAGVVRAACRSVLQGAPEAAEA